ncbi:uncharacterized protein LOC130699428 [Daphnia carinata]|uniref:uncharacterized protein LOC130699428 n=1 Tax=Daphnia carinata TaxID=120202 RepID=UPI00257E9636|nr:uncharacterized protein LOC130699428 [Daphnia carinata]
MAKIATTVLLLAIVAFIINDSYSASVTKSEAGFAEGFSTVNVDNVEVKKMADYAIKAISSSSKLGSIKLIRIVKAETQTVAGVNYKLNLELDYTNTGENALPLPCEVVVFRQPLTDVRELRQLKCFPSAYTKTA